MDLTRKLYSVRFQEHSCGKDRRYDRIWRKRFDVATAALFAEMVGGMQRTLDITVEYAKMRKQFGKPIGMFQAVQHQCADMYLETESSRSAAYYAAWALEENAPDAPWPSRLQKCTRATPAARRQSRHSGAWRAWVSRGKMTCTFITGGRNHSETAFGDSTFHRERIARLVIDAGEKLAKSA